MELFEDRNLGFCLLGTSSVVRQQNWSASHWERSKSNINFMFLPHSRCDYISANILSYLFSQSPIPRYYRISLRHIYPLLVGFNFGDTRHTIRAIPLRSLGTWTGGRDISSLTYMITKFQYSYRPVMAISSFNLPPLLRAPPLLSTGFHEWSLP